MRGNVKTYSTSGPVWSHDPAIPSRSNPEIPKNPDDLTEGLKYGRFRIPLFKDDERRSKDAIRQIRTCVRQIDNGTKICYEQRNEYTSWYTLYVPKMDDHYIRIYQDLGFDLVRIYKTLSKKKRGKHFHRIRL